MLTCKETSFLASKKLDKKLSLKERFGFWLHISMCKLCRHYAKDINKLHVMMQKAGQSGTASLSESVGLSEQSRERIKQAIERALQQTD